MKSMFNQVLLLITGMVLSLNVPAQTTNAGPDSVAFKYKGFGSGRFTFSDGGTKEIAMIDKGAELVYYKKTSFGRDLGNSALTILTGIGFSSSTDASWRVKGRVECNDGRPDWILSLFCEGTEETQRTRVRDSDGSFSVEEETSAVFYWEKDASGVLQEGSDTIAFFLIVMNPRQDSLMKPMTEYFFPPLQIKEPPKRQTIVEFFDSTFPFREYGITGSYRGKQFTIISEGTQYKSWILFDNKYIAMFQSDRISPMVRKKDAIVPYIMIKDNETGLERSDFFRLAMLIRYLNLRIGG